MPYSSDYSDCSRTSDHPPQRALQSGSLNMSHPPRETSKVVRLIEIADDREGAPLHIRLYRRIRDLVRDGALPPGTKLPPSRMLARALGISRNSVVAAYERLNADGWTQSRRGSGIRVSDVVPVLQSKTRMERGDAIKDAPEPIPFDFVPALDLFPIDRWRSLQAKCWRNLPASALREGYVAGWPALREAIASHVAATRGCRCGPHQVFVTTGARAAVDLTMRALGLAGTTAWVEDPGYFAARGSLRANQVRIVPVPVDDDGMRIEDGIAAAPDARFAIVTPATQFPLAVEMSQARRSALLDWAARAASWIVEDDYDADFVTGGRAAAPLAASANAGRVIYIASFNKSLFPALRIAYAIVPDGLIDKFIAAQGANDGSSNVPNQIVLSEFINRGFLDEHLILSRKEFARRRSAMAKAIENDLAEYLSLKPGNSGTHFVANVLEHGEMQFVRIAQSCGVELTPMRLFSELVDLPPAVLMGFTAFEPPAIAAAARRLRAALDA